MGNTGFISCFARLSAVPADIRFTVTGDSRARELSDRQAVPNDQAATSNGKKIPNTMLFAVLTLMETSGYQPHSHHSYASIWSRLRDGAVVLPRVLRDLSDTTKTSVTSVSQIARHSFVNGDRQCAEITTILLCLF